MTLRRKSRMDGRYKGCVNQTDMNLRAWFGITLTQYNELLAAQGGGCAMCGKPPSWRRLAVDHDHQTGKIRGLLCAGCNVSLGHYEKSHALCAEYLARTWEHGLVVAPGSRPPSFYRRAEETEGIVTQEHNDVQPTLLDLMST